MKFMKFPFGIHSLNDLKTISSECFCDPLTISIMGSRVYQRLFHGLYPIQITTDHHIVKMKPDPVMYDFPTNNLDNILLN